MLGQGLVVTAGLMMVGAGPLVVTAWLRAVVFAAWVGGGCSVCSYHDEGLFLKHKNNRNQYCILYYVEINTILR